MTSVFLLRPTLIAWLLVPIHAVKVEIEFQTRWEGNWPIVHYVPACSANNILHCNHICRLCRATHKPSCWNQKSTDISQALYYISDTNGKDHLSDPFGTSVVRYVVSKNFTSHLQGICCPAFGCQTWRYKLSFFSTFYFLIELSLLVSKIFVIYLASRGSPVGIATASGEFESC